ncbi:hypothetical protein VTO42DRAFT_1572 [Malbranchea cinnamomea]
MTSKITGVLAKKVLKESAENKFGQEDPYFETVPATNLFGQQRMKKRKKAAPEGISQHDAKVLTKVKRRAYRLDLCLCNCCGIRFGWSSVIGLIPAFGDALDMFMALMVVATCNKIEGGLPANLRLHMLLNVVLDFFIGLIPFVGDLADAVYKCNTRNAVILESYLKKKGQKNLKQMSRPLTEPDSSQGSGGASGPTAPSNEPARPQPARVHTADSHGSGRSPGRKTRAHDLEMGL